jgi:hypothetical protein
MARKTRKCSLERRTSSRLRPEAGQIRKQQISQSHMILLLGSSFFSKSLREAIQSLRTYIHNSYVSSEIAAILVIKTMF